MLFRQAVRALVLDPENNVLLVHFDWEGLDLEDGFWANPGGGIEPGESHEAALRRELREEVGVVDFRLGPHIWAKRSYFDGGQYGDQFDGQKDHIYLVHVDVQTTRGELTAAQLAAENVVGVRWWSAADVIAGRGVFAPRVLPELLTQLITEGPPDSPILLEGH